MKESVVEKYVHFCTNLTVNTDIASYKPNLAF